MLYVGLSTASNFTTFISCLCNKKNQLSKHCFFDVFAESLPRTLRLLRHTRQRALAQPHCATVRYAVSQENRQKQNQL
jgi:hypothetical protein